MLERYIIIPFSSSLLPLLHNKSSFKTFHIKLSWIYMKINTLMQQMVPKDSFLVLTEAKRNSAASGLLRYLGGVKGAGERKREAASNSIHSSVT